MSLTLGHTTTYQFAPIGADAYTAPVSIGRRVVALREKRGWSQVELAKRSGLNSQTVHRIEHGVSDASVKSRQGLAKAFGIAVAQLDESVEDHDEPTPPFLPLGALTEAQLLESVAALVRELERRKATPPTPEPPPDPPATQPSPRRRRPR